MLRSSKADEEGLTMTRTMMVAAALAVALAVGCEGEGGTGPDGGGYGLAQIGEPCEADGDCVPEGYCPNSARTCQRYDCRDIDDGYGLVCHPWPGCTPDDPYNCETMSCETDSDCFRE